MPSALQGYEEQLTELTTQRERMREIVAKWWTLGGGRSLTADYLRRAMCARRRRDERMRDGQDEAAVAALDPRTRRLNLAQDD